ncbi:NAD(P)H-binding protein [Limosilactobacillus sp.]|uniref:NAD(P)H-binding protein n=1 Tax=Limosilactobacillus sp. TaxID=2773925 RepID=UPI003F0D5882
MKIGITGVTGHFGYDVVKDLINQGYNTKNIIGLARNVEKAKKQVPSIEIRKADFDNLELMEKALQGLDRVLLVSTKEPDPQKRIVQHTNVIKAAKHNHLSLLVYTSGTKPDQNPLGFAHMKTEEFLQSSSVPYIILRNNYYLEVKLNDIQRAINNQPIVTNVGKGKFGLALRSEYAQAAANVLIKPLAINQTYNLTANLVDYATFVSTLEKVLNKPVKLKNITDDEMEKAMINNRISDPVASLMTKANAAIRNGAGDEVSDDFKKLLGRQPKGLEESIKALLK